MWGFSRCPIRTVLCGDGQRLQVGRRRIPLQMVWYGSCPCNVRPPRFRAPAPRSCLRRHMTSANNNHTLHRVRVAVADDEVELRDYWQKILPRLGFELVGVVSSGEELVQLCRQVAPDVIITDACFNGLSGVEAVAAIRRSLPVGAVFVTGKLYEDEAVGHGTGVVVLTKPFTIDEVPTAVEAALRISMEQNDCESCSARPRQPASPGRQSGDGGGSACGRDA